MNGNWYVHVYYGNKTIFLLLPLNGLILSPLCASVTIVLHRGVFSHKTYFKVSTSNCNKYTKYILKIYINKAEFSIELDEVITYFISRKKHRLSFLFSLSVFTKNIKKIKQIQKFSSILKFLLQFLFLLYKNAWNYLSKIMKFMSSGRC